MKRISDYINYHRTKGLLAWVLALVLALTGCGAKEASATPVQTPMQSAEPVPVEGGELVIAMAQNPSSMNPLLADTTEMVNLFSLIYEGLVQYDATQKLVPGLAESWKSDETGCVWTFNLRQGVKFHDGTELKSADVIATLAALKGKQSGATPTSSQPEETANPEGGVGPTTSPNTNSNSLDRSIYASGAALIKTFEAVDDYTIKIEATKPGIRILDALVFPILKDGQASVQKPIGTGPYQVEQYKKGEEMRLVRNESWWRTAPYIQSIVAKGYGDSEKALAAYELRQVDFVQTSILTVGKYREVSNTTIEDVMTQYYQCILPNFAHNAMTKLEMRKAISLIIDQREIVSQVYMGHATPSDVPIPPDSHLYDAKSKVYEPDLQAAKALLAEIGYDRENGDGMLTDRNGQVLTLRLLVLDSSSNPQAKEVAELVQRQMEDAGILLKVEALGQKDYQQALVAGNYDLAIADYYLSRDGDLAFMLKPGGAANRNFYSNSAVTECIDKANAALNETERQAAFAQMQKLLLEDVAQIGLLFKNQSVIYTGQLQGVKNMRELNLYRSVQEWYLQP